jgi:O-antigen/teichoic acid export membrane protein
VIGARLFWHIPINVAQAIAGFGAIWAFTRLLSPHDYGLYALALSTMMLAHTCALTWAESAAYRFRLTAENEGALPDHFATLLALAVASALLAGIASAIGLIFFVDQSVLLNLVVFSAVYALLRFLIKIERETDRAEMAVARYSILESFYVLAGFALGVAFIMNTNLGPAGPLAGGALAGLMVAFVDGPRLLKRAKGGRPSLARAQTYALYGMPLAGALALEMFVQTATRGLIALHLDAAAVGAYAAAFGLAGRVLDIVFIWAGMATGPLLLNAYEKEGRVGAERVARNVALVLLLLAMPAAIGLALVARPLAEAMVGEGLREDAIAIVPWLALTSLASGFITYYFSEAFTLARKTGIRALIMLVPAGLTLLLCALLLPVFGAVGAAIATSAASLVGALLLALFGRRYVVMSLPWLDLFKILLACALMAAPIHFAPDLGGWPELFLKGALGALTYGAAIFILDAGDARANVRRFLDRARARLRRADAPEAP